MPESSYPAKSREAGRYIRRSDQIKWGTAVACVLVAFFSIVLVLAGYNWHVTADQTEIHRDRQSRSENANQEQTQLPSNLRVGKVLSREGRHCREMVFDNATGRSQDGGFVACYEESAANGKYDYPSTRLKSIRNQFSKE